MSDTAFAGRSPALSGHGAAAACVTWRVPGTRRALQLALAGIWLLDAVLQYQSWMFTRAFGQMLADSAAGNPGFIARPITWSSGIIEHHPVSTNTAFATIQLLLALGIAWRPALKAALAASVVWSVAVWWLGEGLAESLTRRPARSAVPRRGGHLWPAGDPAWPSDRWPEAASPPRGPWARPPRGRRGWCCGKQGHSSLLPGNRAPQALHDMVAGMADGEPGWLAAWTMRGPPARPPGPAASIVRPSSSPSRPRRVRAGPGSACGRGRRGGRGRGVLAVRPDLGRTFTVNGQTPTPGRCCPCWPWPTGRPGPAARDGASRGGGPASANQPEGQ